jgi:putative oxidoreductase
MSSVSTNRTVAAGNIASIAFAPRSRSRAWTVGLWIVQILSAAMFLVAGASKLSGGPEMVQVFEAIGIGQWFRYLTGAIEVASAVLLLIPRLAVFGALLLVPTMVGAVATHLFVLGGSPAPAFILLVGCSLILWARRRELARVIAAIG